MPPEPEDKSSKTASQRRFAHLAGYQRSVRRNAWGQTGNPDYIDGVGLNAKGSEDLVQPIPPPPPLWTRPPVVDWREECRGRYGDHR